MTLLGRTRSGLILSVLASLVACDSPPKFSRIPGFGDGNQADGGTSDGGAEGEDMPRYAAVLGDYTASWISLLDGTGQIVADGYIHSGARPSNLVTALSGDVALPTESGEPSVLVLIDRFQTDAITRIRLSDGSILGQLKTHTPPQQTASSTFSSNPQDYVYIDQHTAWVSRHEPNLDPSVPELERGTDLLRIDPSRMERTQDRIDLSSLNTSGTRKNPDTGEVETVEVFARPSRMVHRGGRLIVGLARLSFDFSTAGEGAVAVIDLATRKVESLTFEGLTNCPDVAPVPFSDEHVLVSCSGFWQGERGVSAGLVMLRVTELGVAIEHTFRVKDHPELPVLVQSPIPLGGSRVAAVAFGNLAGEGKPEPDIFGVLDLADASFSQVFAAQTAFVLGSGVFDAQNSLVLLPDASVDKNKRPTAGIRRFRVRSEQVLEALDTISTRGGTTMPVHAIYPL